MQLLEGNVIHTQTSIMGSHEISMVQDSVKYLGLPVHPQLKSDVIQRDLVQTPQELLNRVDATFLSGRQKVLLYNRAIAPRFNWLLSILDLSLTWIANNLEKLVV